MNSLQTQRAEAEQIFISFLYQMSRPGPNGLQAAPAYFKFPPHLPSGIAPGSPLAPVWSRFLWPNEYLLFELSFPRCSFHSAKFNLVLLFPAPSFLNLFGDIVICWVLRRLPNLEASVIFINKRIFLSNLLIKTLRNNISVRDYAPYLETLALLTDCFIY